MPKDRHSKPPRVVAYTHEEDGGVSDAGEDFSLPLTPTWQTVVSIMPRNACDTLIRYSSLRSLLAPLGYTRDLSKVCAAKKVKSNPELARAMERQAL